MRRSFERCLVYCLPQTKTYAGQRRRAGMYAFGLQTVRSQNEVAWDLVLQLAFHEQCRARQPHRPTPGARPPAISLVSAV